MMKKTLYFFMLIHISLVVQSQDYITKKDSTKIEASILEINSSDIIYRFYNYPDGPKITLTKSDIAYIIYKNGTKEAFIQQEKQPNTHTELPELKKSEIAKTTETEYKPKNRVFAPFMCHAGFVFNNRYANVPLKDPDLGMTAGLYYTPASQHTTMSYQFGFNFLLGRSPFCKFVIGANYLRSVGEYNIHYSAISGGSAPWTSVTEYYKVNSTVDFINIVGGVRFTIAKKFHIEHLMTINLIAKSSTRYTGYQNTHVFSNGYTGNSYTNISNETTYYTNEKIPSQTNDIGITISFCPRLTYDIKIKEQTFGIYASYNMALNYHLPWFVAGITYYPFKKLK
jgi:hypothetical protein